METVKKISQMTDEELSQLSDNEIVNLSFQETIDEINLDTEYLGDASRHIIGTFTISVLLSFFVSVSYLFLLSFIIPVFLLYVFNNIVKHRKFYIRLLHSEHKMYLSTGKFSKEYLDSFLEKIDLTIKL